MPVPESWKKKGTYGKIIGHLINSGYSKESAKAKTEKVMEAYKRKKGKKK
jgi:hypothetical protein